MAANSRLDASKRREQLYRQRGASTRPLTGCVCALLLQQATFLIFFAVACVLYVGGGAGYAVKVQGKTFAQDGERHRRLLPAFRS